GLFALYEGQEKLRHPHEIESVAWAVGILLFAVAMEANACRTAVAESRKVKGDQSWPSFIRHARIPELPVVLLEDIGALLGLVFALVGVGLAEATGDPRYDALGTLAIGVLLTLIAVVLAVEMKSLLIGEAAAPDELEAISGAICATDGIVQLVHLRTSHLGPEDLLVVAKISVDGTSRTSEVAALIDRAEEAVRAAVPHAGLIYLEPIASTT
ncbi:MAG: cation diffusion facilitator family transporter, partial [Acidimicrobiia bacterium]